MFRGRVEAIGKIRKKRKHGLPVSERGTTFRGKEQAVIGNVRAGWLLQCWHLLVLQKTMNILF